MYFCYPNNIYILDKYKMSPYYMLDTMYIFVYIYVYKIFCFQ